MLGLTIFGVLFSVVISQDIIGVNYSFDDDFERVFDNKSCDRHDNWSLVEYADLKISARDSPKGIRSRKESCTSSFPIVFIDDSVLDLNVFLDVTAEKSGLEINVFDENGIPEVTYWYSNSNNNYKLGWNRISILIHVNVTGYINLIGHSQDYEIVIVDSFQYNANPSNRINYDISKSSLIYETEDLLGNIHEELDLLFEGSGEGSGEEYDLHLGEDLEEDLDEKGITKIEE